MRMILPLLTLLSGPVGEPASAGPRYATPETQRVIEAMVAAHGGMEAWHRISEVRYRFFTRNTGAPPWLSWERVETRTRRARIDWPVFDAVVAYDGSDVWSTRWPIPLSPGFFANLTYGFITLPFQTQQDGVRLEAPQQGTLPGDDTTYVTVRMTMDRPRGLMPGTYYRLFIHPETHLLHALEFDISHPGLVSIPNQSIGPNFHVFSERQEVGGVLFPAFYTSSGSRAGNLVERRAVHYVFDLSVSGTFDATAVRRPPEAMSDTVTTLFWSRKQ